MNRRSFFSTVAKAAAAFAILPAATTYARSWKPTEAGVWVMNTEWITAPYEIRWFSVRSLGASLYLNDGIPPGIYRLTVENGKLKQIPKWTKS